MVDGRSGSTLDRGRGRQRLRRMLGPRLKTPGSGDLAQRGCRSQPRQDCAGSGVPDRERPGREADLEGTRVRVAVEAEAGGSPSSEAPPGWLVWQAASGHPPRRRPVHGPGRAGVFERARREASCAERRSRESSNPRGAREVKSVAEVGETHLSRSVRGKSRERWDSLKRTAGP